MRYNGAKTNAIEKTWYAGDFAGDKRPHVRCTVHRGNVRLTPSGNGYGDFASIIFSVGNQSSGGHYVYYPRELPNIKSLSWSRSTDQQVAQATIEIYANIGASTTEGFDMRGFYTWNHGEGATAKSRGLTMNQWYGLLVPNNVIRTYEGYGADFDVGPERDPHMLCTGNWMIDKVDVTGNIITLTCRDFGRILIDQIIFPPITPRSSPIPGIQYPISFTSYAKEEIAAGEAYTGQSMQFSDSSNTPYVGHDGYQNGHFAREAMDGNSDTYWLSVGNGAPNAGYSYEWIEGTAGSQRIGSVNVHALFANLQGYVSVMSGGVWVNSVGVIPYDPSNPNSAPNGANIPAVARFTTTGANQRINFSPVSGVQRVRLTFTNLQNSGIGPFVYRAGVREFGIYSAKATPKSTRRVRQKGFNYGDYTDIVKLFCAWGGFHWPKPSDGPFIAVSEGPGQPDGFAFPLYAKPPNDGYLKNGRIWGDFMQTGAYGAASLPIETFDKKTLMDGITAIQDIVGFLFYIDEAGGVQWRFPNYKERGNLVNGRRQQRFLRILDTHSIITTTATLDGRNARERVYVASADGKFVGGSRGYELNPIGLRRVSGWVDSHWTNEYDVQTAANLIAVAQMMSYRSATTTIPGLPTLQMDDQVEIIDVDSGQGHLHWVNQIQCKIDNYTGEYTYTLTSSWLGDRTATGNWAFNRFGKLSSNTEVLLDYYDRHRHDGIYDSFAPVTFPTSS